MTLVELAKALPGYVTMQIHTQTERWHGMPAGSVAAGRFPHQAEVVNLNPFAPYTVEVLIEVKEEQA